MATTKVNSEFIAVNAISGTIIADGAITSTHLAANSVDTAELVTGSIDTIHIAANQVTSAKIVSDAVLTRHIADDQVTQALIAVNSVGISELAVTEGSDGQVLTTNGSGTLSFATVSGTTINNNADNRVITGSGTANTLEGESTLTFGGGKLGIGTASAVKTLDIAGSAPYLRITDTRQATWSAGDEFGGIEWYTEDTSANGPLVGASIYTENSQSSATPDQELIFATAPHNDASGPSERLRISSDGNIDAGSSNTTSIRIPNGTTAQRPTGANGMLRYNSTLGGIEEYRASAWHTLSDLFSGSGGTETTSGIYTYHAFTSSGAITFNAAGTIDILVVGGGGGGGDNSNIRAAGAGAGGLIYISGYSVAGVQYTVGIGAGGAEGASGTNTTFSGNGVTLTALGGGMGGYNDSTDNGADGGSGGGQWYPGYSGASGTQPTNTSDGTTTYNSTGFGNDGGTSGGSHPYGSGGGGAGAAGGNFNATGGPVGGAGKDMSSIFGTTYGESGWFAGGGGSGSYPGVQDNKFDGGQGGGGRGWNNGTESEQNGTANTGGGGGAGGSGGSGIVIVRYQT
jgi:hypothetical protein